MTCEGVDPHLLNVGTTWNRLVIFAPQWLYPPRKNPFTYWIGISAGSRSGYNHADKYFLLLQGIDV
jgi:hypothetical protein